MSLQAVLLSSLLVACGATTLYNPPNAGNALDAIEAALSQIVNNKHLPASQIKEAKSVADSVEKTVAELESPQGKKLSDKVRAEKVTAAIKLLQGLQDKWSKASSDKLAEKEAALKKELEEKEKLLAKEQKMLKVATLEKKLAEKKLALEKLVEMKNEQNAKKEQEKNSAARQAWVTGVLEMAKKLQGKSASKAADQKTVLANLESRKQTVTDTLAKFDASEKSGEAEAEKALNAQGASKELKKESSMLKMLLKKQHRQYDKARAPLKSELKDLNEAVKSLKAGDAAGLAKVGARMQDAMKNVQAKSQKFLY